MDAEIDSKTFSKELGSESGECVISNNTSAFYPVLGGPRGSEMEEKLKKFHFDRFQAM